MLQSFYPFVFFVNAVSFGADGRFANVKRFLNFSENRRQFAPEQSLTLER